MMTTQEIQAALERAEKATPGPWRDETWLEDVPGCGLFGRPTSDSSHAGLRIANFYNVREEGVANLEFCAQARTDLPALARDLLMAREELAKAQAEQAAIWGALEELGKWPELAKIDFFTVRNGEECAVKPSLVAPVFEAIRKHSRGMLSFGKSCVEALYNQERMKGDLLAARERIAELESTLDNIGST